MISSSKNRKIINLRKLQQRKHRLAQQRFAVEGLQLLGMALEAGHQPLEVFYCTACFSGDIASQLLTALQAQASFTSSVSLSVMQTLSERDSPQGLIATFSLFASNLDELIRPEPNLIIMVDRLQDPGNLGTLIRTADAVAASGVILIEPCVDAFDPKTIRGSMGSLFNLPLVWSAEPVAMLKKLHQQGYNLTGADGYRGQIPWHTDSAALKGPTALVLGNEARGLSNDLRACLTHWVRLPLLGGAESLNVAVAGGILLYQWLQQNQIIQP